MTLEQKKMVRYWWFLIAFILAGLYISFSDIENKQIALLFLLIPISIFSMFQDFSYYTGYGKNGERIGEFVEKHPMLKLYLVVYCATVLPFIVYKLGTTKHGNTTDILYFLSLFLLIGPVAIVSERERFKSLGK